MEAGDEVRSPHPVGLRPTILPRWRGRDGCSLICSTLELRSGNCGSATCSIPPLQGEGGCALLRADGWGLLQRAVPAGEVHVDRTDLDAVVLGVAHDLRRRVEAHRLAVEERGGEHVRVVAFDPGRGVDQEGEARRVALGKAVLAEALDLAEAALGELAPVAVRHHAVDQLVAKVGDGADPLEGRHGAAQLVGLGGREARRHDGDAHRLLLEQRHAERLAQHRLQLRWMRVVDLLDPLPAAQIGMHHVALDRSGPHDRDLDDEIVEFLRAAAAAASTSARGSRSGTRRSCRRAGSCGRPPCPRPAETGYASRRSARAADRTSGAGRTACRARARRP